MVRPEPRRNGGVNNAYWFTIHGGDGFYTAQDPTDPNIVYGESQGGSASRVNLKTGERLSFASRRGRTQYRKWEDSIAIDPRRSAQAGDSKDVNGAIARLRAQQRAGFDRPGTPLQLELAVLHLAAQSGSDLFRRQPRAQVDEARREISS